MSFKTGFICALNYLVVYPETPLFFSGCLGYFCTICTDARVNYLVCYLVGICVAGLLGSAAGVELDVTAGTGTWAGVAGVAAGVAWVA
jgi:hypothetical protein